MRQDKFSELASPFKVDRRRIKILSEDGGDGRGPRRLVAGASSEEAGFVLAPWSLRGAISEDRAHEGVCAVAEGRM